MDYTQRNVKMRQNRIGDIKVQYNSEQTTKRRHMQQMRTEIYQDLLFRDNET